MSSNPNPTKTSVPPMQYMCISSTAFRWEYCGFDWGGGVQYQYKGIHGRTSRKAPKPETLNPKHRLGQGRIRSPELDLKIYCRSLNNYQSWFGGMVKLGMKVNTLDPVCFCRPLHWDALEVSFRFMPRALMWVPCVAITDVQMWDYFKVMNRFFFLKSGTSSGGGSSSSSTTTTTTSTTTEKCTG